MQTGQLVPSGMQPLYPARNQTSISRGKAMVRSLAANLDVGCPEVLHERPSFTAPGPVYGLLGR